MTPADPPIAKHVAREATEVRKSAQNLEASAVAVEKSAAEQTDSADRRTELAADRTVLAAERTYAAWVRTGMAELASGVAVRPLLQNRVTDWVLTATAALLLVYAIFCFVAAVWRQLQPGVPPPRPDTRRLPVPIFIVANSFLSLAAIAALLELAVGRI